MHKSTSKLFAEITRIGNRAVKKAQDENRQNGLPNVYEIDNKIVYALPDGTFTTTYKFD